MSYEGLAFNISKKLELYFDIELKGLKDESDNILYYIVNNSHETTQTKKVVLHVLFVYASHCCKYYLYQIRSWK